MKYDLSLLTDREFQRLINELIQKKLHDKLVEQFREGKDLGIDGLVHLSSTETMIIQSKHYLKTGFTGLYNNIKNSELSKIAKLKPCKYVLATSLDLSVNESDKLKKLIQNSIPTIAVDIWSYSTIESQLNIYPDIVKATIKLWAQNVDIVKHILNPEAETSFLCLQTKWKKIDKYFVPFENINKYTEKLDSEHVLIISGEPGIGKTTLAEYLCKLYFISGFKIVIINGFDFNNNIDLTNPDDKILFYFDDFLGTNYFSGIEGSFDRQLIDVFKQVKFYRNKRFILTSRTNIIEKGTYLSQSFSDYHLKDLTIPIMSIDSSDKVKSQILYNHLWHSQLKQDLIEDFVRKKEFRDVIHHQNFNPRIIEFITEKKNYEESIGDYITFVKKSLDNPSEIWRRCYWGQLNEAQRTLIKLVVANEGRINEENLKNAYNRAYDIFHLSCNNHEPIDYNYVFDICENSLLKREYFEHDDKKIFNISTFNPSVNDFVIPLISNRFELEKLFSCLNSMESIRFICSINFEDKVRFLLWILDSQSEYTDVKICALKELQRLNNRSAEKYIKEVICVPSIKIRDIYEIVVQNMGAIDFTTFIDNHICDDFLDCNSLYELYNKYSNSCFYKENVSNKIYKLFYVNLKKSINELLHNDVDFFSAYTIESGYKCLNHILDNFPLLKEKDRNEIFESIDMQKEIDEKIEQVDFDYDEYGRLSDSDWVDFPDVDSDLSFEGLLDR